MSPVSWKLSISAACVKSCIVIGGVARHKWSRLLRPLFWEFVFTITTVSMSYIDLAVVFIVIIATALFCQGMVCCSGANIWLMNRSMKDVLSSASTARFLTFPIPACTCVYPIATARGRMSFMVPNMRLAICNCVALIDLLTSFPAGSTKILFIRFWGAPEWTWLAMVKVFYVTTIKVRMCKAGLQKDGRSCGYCQTVR